MLTTVHRATDVRIFHREAKTLAQAGFDVTVIGPHPSSEKLAGVFIDALQQPESRLSRALLSWQLLRRARQRQKALFIFHDPELLWVGLVLRSLRHNVIYDSHENVPMQILQKRWLPRFVRWVLFPLVWMAEAISSRLLSGIIVVGDTYRWRFPRRRTVLVRNFAPLADISPSEKEIPIEKRRPIVIYAGGLQEIRGITELVRAFREMESSKAELWLVGPFHTESYQEEILASLPPNVKWFGRKEYSEVLELYQVAKIGAVLHHPAPNHRNALPIKIFEYMAAGLPVITSQLPQFNEIIEGCGAHVDSHDVQQIRESIETLISDTPKLRAMSKTARERVIALYSWESEGKKLIHLCRKLTCSVES
ncbi:MAG: glycosyltransferase [Acidobacteriaceae bacterium]|nr:glycosyltransferase [Acidobacteriaceae bacterium]